MNDTFEITVRVGDQVTTIATGNLGDKGLDLSEHADRELIAAMVDVWVEAP